MYCCCCCLVRASECAVRHLGCAHRGPLRQLCVCGVCVCACVCVCVCVCVRCTCVFVSLCVAHLQAVASTRRRGAVASRGYMGQAGYAWGPIKRSGCLQVTQAEYWTHYPQNEGLAGTVELLHKGTSPRQPLW